MRITVSKTGPPLNHSLWTFIYLCCFLLGLCMQVKCKGQTVHQWRVTYEFKSYAHTHEVFDHTTIT